ncbi:hypothetical protein C8R44DRAFT_723558 [Mycena epipterygia]|nr:hypothetical protein C8R44DRAFT_723558 [Mycena epipterygia]
MSFATSTALAVASRHIPSEIWTEIFAQLPRVVLMHTALAHGLFHRTTRPLLFCDFELHPYTIMAGGTRTAIFAGGKSAHRIGGSFQLHAALHQPPSFVPVYKQMVMRNVCSLPNFTILDLDFCSVAEGGAIDYSTLVLPHISEFRFTYDASIVGMDHWPPRICADTLRHLDISYNDRLFNCLEDYSAFPSVTNLKITVREQTISRDLGVISKFTRVEVLTILGSLPWEDSWESPPLLLPDRTSLNQYTGSYQLLHLFLPVPTLRRVVIYRYDAPMVLLNKLQTIYPHHITSLDVEFNEILKTMCRVFPNVTELRVKTSILMWDNHFLGGDRP